MAVIHNGQNGQCVPSHVGEVFRQELDHVQILNQRMAGKPVLNKILDLKLNHKLVELIFALVSRGYFPQIYHTSVTFICIDIKHEFRNVKGLQPDHFSVIF